MEEPEKSQNSSSASAVLNGRRLSEAYVRRSLFLTSLDRVGGQSLDLGKRVVSVCVHAGSDIICQLSHLDLVLESLETPHLLTLEF